jgi:hypothetical protein
LHHPSLHLRWFARAFARRSHSLSCPLFSQLASSLTHAQSKSTKHSPPACCSAITSSFYSRRKSFVPALGNRTRQIQTRNTQVENKTSTSFLYLTTDEASNSKTPQQLQNAFLCRQKWNDQVKKSVQWSFFGKLLCTTADQPRVRVRGIFRLSRVNCPPS